jgi:hypothetical protein
MNKKEYFYISLIGAFAGLYLKVEANDKYVVERWANYQLGRNWKNVNTEDEIKYTDSQVIGLIIRLVEKPLAETLSPNGIEVTYY